MPSETGIEPTGRPAALDPRAPYTSRLSARSALYTDLQILLDERSEPLSLDDINDLVHQVRHQRRTG